MKEDRLVERVVDRVALLSGDVLEDVGLLNDIRDAALLEAQDRIL